MKQFDTDDNRQIGSRAARREALCVHALVLAMAVAPLACGGGSTTDRTQAPSGNDSPPIKEPKRDDAKAPPPNAPAEAAAEAPHTPSTDSPTNTNALIVKVDGEPMPAKRAFAYTDGPKTMVMLTNAEMECGTFFEPGRGYGPEEKHVFLWLESASGTWKVTGVMVRSSSRSGDGLGTVRSAHGTANDELHADLTVDTEIVSPPQFNEPAIKVTIEGNIVAKGCGKNPAGL